MIPIPSAEEQEIISSEVRMYFQYVKAVKSLERLLREYRNKTISNVVTGAVDVRGIEIPDLITEDFIVDEVENSEGDDDDSVDESEEVEENVDN
jgi:type I restriction enzyme S subunit